MFRPQNVFRHETRDETDYDVTSKPQTFVRHSAMVLYRLVWCMCTGNALYRPTMAGEQLQYTAGIQCDATRVESDERHAYNVIYINMQIFVSPAIMAYTPKCF